MTMTQIGMLFFYTLAIGGFAYLIGAFQEWDSNQEEKKALYREREHLLELIHENNIAAIRQSKRVAKPTAKRGQ